MSTGKKIVLVVDDSPIIIERLNSMLAGLENVQSIIYAKNYATAILLLEEKPDIAILDINLPDKSGIELLRYIKNSNAAVTVIMLTNQSGDYYRNLCMRLGAQYFIDKSSEFEQVPSIISSVS
jgi:DNA-binding NarL/FixJ family response regulator